MFLLMVLCSLLLQLIPLLLGSMTVLLEIKRIPHLLSFIMSFTLMIIASSFLISPGVDRYLASGVLLLRATYWLGIGLLIGGILKHTLLGRE